MEFTHFVGVSDHAVSDGICDIATRWFENMHSMGFTRNRQITEKTPKYIKEDDSLFMGDLLEMPDTRNRDVQIAVKDSIFQVQLPQYFNQYDVLRDNGPLHLFDMKLQKTPVGGGYHIWHYETGYRIGATRSLSFILYLNDVEEGGETEFLYYPLRVKPKKGRMVIFPGHFTHTHRGNPPLSGEKFVLTGWLEL